MDTAIRASLGCGDRKAIFLKDRAERLLAAPETRDGQRIIGSVCAFAAEGLMRTFAAVTTFHREGYHLYGRRMLQSFDRCWPESVALYAYAEDCELDIRGGRIIYLDLMRECPELVEFKRKHRANPIAHGERAWKRWRVDWKTLKVKIRRIECGLGSRWDAVRFSHKCFAIFAAAERCEHDVLFWIDADMVFFEDIPRNFIEELMPPDCLLSFLMRADHSECGFVGYNLRHPAMPDFLRQFKELYTQDKLFKCREFHDSYLFDVIRKRFERKGHRTYDIAEGIGAHARHVLINSKLGRYMDHLKGERKTQGSSEAEDLVVQRTEKYWRGRKT
jgi:hypothetical protein